MAIPQSNTEGNRGRWFKLAFFGGFLLAVVGLGAAVGAVVNAAEAVPPEPNIRVPDWLWATMFAGIVQGLVWYGAINSKLTWLMSRLDTLEKRFNRHIEHARHREGDAGD